MFASSQLRPYPVSWSTVCRWTARASAAVLVIAWICFAVTETIRTDFYLPFWLKVQGAAIAAIFAGYAVGWRWELIGGLLAIVGMVAFFAINTFAVGKSPQLVAALFAVPGLFYLEAWHRDRRERAQSHA